MKCSRPFTQGVAEFGCGQCSPCLLNRRRLWTARLMLEARKHQFSFFVTLTYDEMHCPRELEPKSLQVFFKKWRKKYGSVRYYAVGEYGERRGRPHYHLALFGLPTGEIRVVAEMVLACWGLGNVHVGYLTTASAGYVASYVTKRWTKKNDSPDGLNSRHPEFSRMSLKPGIGAPAISDFARVLADGVDLKTGEVYGLPDADVPSSFRFDGQELPLGRYLRGKLREKLGKPKIEPVAVGELRNYRRFVDLRAAGLNGWRVREARRQQAEWNAKGYLQRAADKKGVWL